MIASNSTKFPYQACLIPDLSEEMQHKLRDATNYGLIPLNLLLTVISFISNGLVILTVARTKPLQQPPMLMLCSLAVTDLIYSQYSIFRIVQVLLHKHICPSPPGDEASALAGLCLLATLSNLAIISRDRYLAVKEPLWYRTHVSKSRALKIICASWLLSAVATIMFYLQKKFHGLLVLVSGVTFLLFYLICFLVITVSYLGIFYNRKTANEDLLNVRAMARREKQMANTVGLILLLLLITFLPGLLIVLVLNVNGVISQPFHPYYGFLLQLNGLLNPLVNFGRSKEMRKALRELVKCSHQVKPSTVMSALEQYQLNNNKNETKLPKLEPLPRPPRPYHSVQIM